MNKTINFDKEAKIIAHRKKQKALIEKIEKDNQLIAAQIKEWERVNNKQVSKEKVYNLPEEIVKLMYQYQYNEKALAQKYQRYKDNKS